ncbi:DUF6804 family protein [Herbiconiux ginsengi]|uniref:Uncharacterized protein n=1 Tax=Herbiconiux ginsengi TaxID=381665 RepID=A0A1H3RMY3_9MICO|nr:DUF6804 family protein [Herbiconiux ginsengi]SDZ26598.1 hypothetical protein SAMN05216554_2908 [Herbiconiux ginsengi]
MIGALFLLLALFPLPGWYYVALRWENSFIAIVVGVLALRSSARLWVAGAIALLIVWNFTIPIYLDRSVWFFLDIAGAALFLVIGWNVPAAKPQDAQNKDGEWVKKQPWPWWRVAGVTLAVLAGYWIAASLLTGGGGGPSDCPAYSNDGRGAYCDL